MESGCGSGDTAWLAATVATSRGDSGRCTFCRIILREVSSAVIFEDEVSFAFLDRRPIFPGHCLLVPKEHYQTLDDLPGSLTGPLFTNVQTLSRAAELGLNADGTFVAINNRISQSVPHLHLHVVPRRRGDGLRGFFWPRQRHTDEDHIRAVQEAIREAIGKVKAAN